MRKKKSRIIKFLKKEDWFAIALAIVLFLLAYYNPSVVIQTEYRTKYVMGTKTDTVTLTATVKATVTRVNGTAENLTKQP